MPIPFTCPHCGHATDVNDRYAGQTGPCSTCGKTVTVPSSSDGATTATGGSSKNVVFVLSLVLAVAVLCGGIVVAVLRPPITAALESSRIAHLKHIAVALGSYESKWGTLPPAYLADEQGRPQHSWRVLILPELDQSELYEQYDFDKPWNSPENLEVARRMPAIYQCPRCPQAAEPGEPGLTHYQFVTGPNTLFEGDVAPSGEDILDGRSMTLKVVESPQQVIWTQPQDLAFKDLDCLTDPDDDHPTNFSALMCDGSCRFLPKDIDPRILRLLVTPRDGEVVEHAQLR